MIRKTRALYIAYLASACFSIGAFYLSYAIVGIVFKAIPMIVLLILLEWDSPYNRLVGFGFAFSLAGDIFLETSLFAIGFIAFVAVHVFYSIAFTKTSNKLGLLRSIPCYAYGIIVFLFLLKYLGPYAIPIGIYILLITTMLWRAFAQAKARAVEEYALVGAVLFTISDSILSYKMFCGNFYIASLLLMVAYWAGQFFIYRSTLRKAR